MIPFLLAKPVRKVHSKLDAPFFLLTGRPQEDLPDLFLPDLVRRKAAGGRLSLFLTDVLKLGFR